MRGESIVGPFRRAIQPQWKNCPSFPDYGTSGEGASVSAMSLRDLASLLALICGMLLVLAA
jgi:hypothetical protein